MKDYSNVKRSDMKTELESMKTVKRSDILNLLCKAYKLGTRESKEFYKDELRAEFVYDNFMLQNYGTAQKPIDYYKKINLPF